MSLLRKLRPASTTRCCDQCSAGCTARALRTQARTKALQFRGGLG